LGGGGHSLGDTGNEGGIPYIFPLQNHGWSPTVSIDKSLKKKSGLARARNVLKRSERITALKDLEKWTEEAGPYALPKVRVFRMAARKAKKKKEEGDAAAAAPAAAGAKPAAAAAGKAAAPAAKAAPAKKK
jgi:small basic protein (TIGR04137 family)